MLFRVLRPPGGGSSNIFGGGEDPLPPCRPVEKGPDVPAAGTPTPLKPEGKGVESDRDRLYGGGQCTDVKIRSGGNQKNQGEPIIICIFSIHLLIDLYCNSNSCI